MTRPMLLLVLAAAVAATVAWLMRRPEARITVQPASTSVSYEHYLEERDEAQREWDEREGLT